MPIRVLVVDDSPLVRQIVSDMLRDEEDVQVVGHARDGVEAVQMVLDLKPDVVTLDVEMPRMDGLSALRAIMAKRPTPVVMFSSRTAAGATTTLEALELGAMDFVCKPSDGTLNSIRQVQEELLIKIRAAQSARVRRPTFFAVADSPTLPRTDKVVLVACSTGGPRSLNALFASLPVGFAAPILIVQHMPPGFIPTLAQRLDAFRTVPCEEAHLGDRVQAGRALMAPSGTHMRVLPGGELEFSSEPTVHSVRPAADHLFKSAAEVYGDRCVALVLSGMGKDGADGALAVHRAGGTVLAESEESCTIFGMPKAAIATGAVHRQIPISEMTGALLEVVGRRPALAS